MLSDPVFLRLQNTLDASALRQKILASNLANIDTPGYSAKDLDFEAVLSSAIEEDGRQDWEIHPSDGPRRRDGNNVSLDQEMTKLTETSLMFQAGSSMAQAKLRMLRNVITGGR